MNHRTTLVMLMGTLLLAAPAVSHAGGSKGTMQEGATSEGAALHISPQKVKEVQLALNKEGYDPGNVDGIWGEESETALKNYQQKKGLEPTGNLDTKTLSQLGVKLEIPMKKSGK